MIAHQADVQSILSDGRVAPTQVSVGLKRIQASRVSPAKEPNASGILFWSIQNASTQTGGWKCPHQAGTRQLKKSIARFINIVIAVF